MFPVVCSFLTKRNIGGTQTIKLFLFRLLLITMPKAIFKQLLDVAAKATERSDPKTSIMFDGIGLVLADNYIEAVHKILSMFQKYDKIINENGVTFNQFSAYNYQ